MTVFKWYKKWQIENLRQNKELRKVKRYRITFTTIDNETVTYETNWLRLSVYRNGIESYKRLLISDENTITVEGITYNTKYITKIKDELLEEGYIKPEILIEYDGSRSYSPRFFNITFDDYEVGDE